MSTAIVSGGFPNLYRTDVSGAPYDKLADRAVARADVAELHAALTPAVEVEPDHHLINIAAKRALTATEFKQMFYARGDDHFELANVYECHNIASNILASVWGKRQVYNGVSLTSTTATALFKVNTIYSPPAWPNPGLTGGNASATSNPLPATSTTGGGSGMKLTVTLNLAGTLIVSVQVTTSGQGYEVGDRITIPASVILADAALGPPTTVSANLVIDLVIADLAGESDLVQNGLEPLSRTNINLGQPAAVKFAVGDKVKITATLGNTLELNGQILGSQGGHYVVVGVGNAGGVDDGQIVIHAKLTADGTVGGVVKVTKSGVVPYNTSRVINYNRLGGRPDDPSGVDMAYGYATDLQRTFFAQFEVMGNLEKDLCVKRDCWTLCSRMSIEDQLYGLAFVAEDCDDVCMRVSCARKWSEVEDALAESCLAENNTIGYGDIVDLYINVRVTNANPKAMDTIIRIRFPVKLTRGPDDLGNWNVVASDAADAVLTTGIPYDSIEGGNMQYANASQTEKQGNYQDQQQTQLPTSTAPGNSNNSTDPHDGVPLT
jgi:hypothetical protein